MAGIIPPALPPSGDRAEPWADARPALTAEQLIADAVRRWHLILLEGQTVSKT